jgi:probable F420-dependent oxidoreductase
MTARLGITVPFDDVPLPAQRDRHRRLVDLGYTDVWSSESDGLDAFTPLALAAAWAPELRVGTAIVPAFTRGPAVIAQQAAALAAAAPAGFALGIGASSPAIVEHWNGTPYEQPLQRTRDLARFLRAALVGERVTEEYETFSIHGFRLSAPPAVPPPVLVAALRPGMVGLGAREADGVVLNWVSASDVATLLAAAGGDAGEVVARIMVAPTSDADAVRAHVRRLITAYLTVPAYAAAQGWLGRGERLAPMAQAWREGDRKRALELVPDDVVDELVVHGPPEACRERIQEYADQGVTTPVIALLPLGDDLDEALTALAPAAS